MSVCMCTLQCITVNRVLKKKNGYMQRLKFCRRVWYNSKGHYCAVARDKAREIECDTFIRAAGKQILVAC